MACASRWPENCASGCPSGPHEVHQIRQSGLRAVPFSLPSLVRCTQAHDGSAEFRSIERQDVTRGSELGAAALPRRSGS